MKWKNFTFLFNVVKNRRNDWGNVMKETAVLYCENQFGKMDGKTSNGLVRKSGKYEILGVIDSTKAGMDAGECLEGKKNGIPIFATLDQVKETLSSVPDYFIYGIAPSEAFLKKEERAIILQAMTDGMDIVNTLHEFLTEDPEFINHAEQTSVQINDVRKPPLKKDMHLFTGRVLEIETPVIAVFGTDSAIGKRTTSVLLEEALIKQGLNAVLVATGQTGLIQGARYGIAVDALPSQFMVGEIENQIMLAHHNEKPDVIIVEGQSSLSHPAYVSSVAILKGSRAGAVIVQHAPKREFLGDFSFMRMPEVKDEITLIENFSKAKVIAITINHEQMTNEEIERAVTDYEMQLNLPATDVLKHGCSKLVESIMDRYPQLKQVDQKVATN